MQLFDQAVGLVKDEAQAIAVLSHKEVGGTSQASAELILSDAQRAIDKGLVKNARRATDKDLVQDATRANAKGLLRDARSQGNHLKDTQNLKGP